MGLLDEYRQITASSSRKDVDDALRSIVDAPSYSLSSPEREKLVEELLKDISILNSGGRLTGGDIGRALLALKTLGRNIFTSNLISRKSNLNVLLLTVKDLRSENPSAADEALRCIANALLLVEGGRESWIDIGGATHCIDILADTASPTCIFLCSRILFLCTASVSSSLLEPLLGSPVPPNTDAVPDSKNELDIIRIISRKLEFLLEGVIQNQPMCKDAMTDLLKLTFNFLCHWPKIALDAENVEMESGDQAPSSGIELPVLGERWSKRLDGILPALRRIFVGLPPMSPPLVAPVTHILHALMPIPANERLYSVWFPQRTEPDALSEPSAPSPGATSGKTKVEESDLNMDVLDHCAELLDSSLAHYLPGNVDPDDSSVKKLCEQEDIKLDHVLTPLVLLLTKLCNSSRACRRKFRDHILPENLDRTVPIEGRSDTLGRCVRLMACVYHSQLKDTVGDLLFATCESNGQILSAQIGYGNAAGYLFGRNILSTPPRGSDAIPGTNPLINPITGTIQQVRPPVPEMTDEEKEREAEKLFVLFDRLEKSGGMENPLKKALREGKLEKYAECAAKDDDSD